MGALIVEIEGAPTGAVPTVVVSKSGVQRVVRQSRTIDSLPPGVYEVRAEEIVIDSVRWTPEPIVQSVQVMANQAAPRASVRFRPSGGSIILTASGLPSYARSTVRITGPAGLQWTALTRDTVLQLGPGAYTLVAEGVNTTDGRFEASPDTRTVTLTPNATESVSFSFGAPRANLTIAIDGLPNGTLAGVGVSGPAGFSGRADVTRTFSGLDAGLYTATAARVVAGGFSYDADALNRDVTLSGTQSRTLAFNYALATGAIAVTVNGLPNGTNGNVTVIGPAGFSRNVPTTQTLIDLAPGTYRITASTVSAQGATFTASPSTMDVVVTRSLVAVPAAVQYNGSMGAMDISVDGLPPTLDASVKITRPNGTSFWITASETVENLPIGQYTLDALTVTGPNDSWDPDVSSMKVQVKKNETVSTGFKYSPRKGAMTVSVVGLPSGVAGSVRITGPDSFNQTITTTSTLTNLTAGTYTVQANSVTNGSTQYTATPASSTVSVTRGNTATHTVSYGGQSTALTVDFSGLPGGTAASATVTGPNGFSRALTSATVLENLAPGTYRITSEAVTTSTAMYSASPATADVTLAAGDRKTQQVAYALTSGSLAVSIGGLPAGSSGTVTVSGPNGFSKQLTGTETLIKLAPGDYTIVAADVVASGTTYKATPASRTVTVSASLVAAAAPITYATALGGLRVTLTGLPAQAAGAATLHGPSGATTSLSQTSITGGLAAGGWEVRGHEVTLNSERYAPSPTTRNVTVVANDTIETSLAFARVTGRLTVNVSGLPSGTSANITVTGPSGFSRVVNSTQTIVGLTAGTYTVSAASVAVGSTNYAPSSASQSVSVTAGGSATSSVAYSGQTTSLSVTVTGVPSGASASIAASGPSGYSQAITGTTTLSGLNSGTYTLTAARIVHGNYGYDGMPASQNVALATGESKSASVAYSASTGALEVAISGLPAGVNAPITVTGPSGFSRAVTSSTTLTDLAPGNYTVAATSTTSGSTSFTPSSTSQSVSVSVGATASRAVVFTSSGTALTVNLSGVPSGANGAVTVTGPSGFTRTVTSSTTLTELAAGTYTVAAANIAHSGATYAPTPTSQTISLSTGQQLTRTVTYAVTSASLAVTVNGVPSGASAAVTVTGPNNYSQALSASQTINGLAPGTYTVSAASLVSGGYTYAATPASASVSLVAGDAKSHELTYAASTGRLTVSVSGLPTGTGAAITVTGPNSYSQQVTAGVTLQNLVPGTYTVAAENVTASNTLYTPSSASQSVSVTAGNTLTRTVTYTATVTSLAVSITGLPSGTNAAVAVTGPSFSQNLTAGTTLTGLAAGTYTVTANNVSSGGYTYGGTPATQSASVTVGSQQSLAVAYSAITGRLSVSVSGLPSGTNAGINVSGPSGFSQTVNATTTLSGLAPGSYAVAATTLSSGGTTYTPSSTSQSVSVTAGATASRSVSYTGSVGDGGGGGTPGANLVVEGAYVTQAIQSFSGDVPLVAGREALLRVFVAAASTNSLTPTVRVRLFTGTTNFRTFTINAPGSSVPTSVSEGTLNSSWNATLTASDMRVGLRIQVDVDPTNLVAEPDETDNVWPRTGTKTLDVRTVAPLNVVFVPVHQSSTGLTGDVTPANLESRYFSMTRQMYPLADINASVRATYTTNTAALQSNDGNSAWLTVLSEINSLRAADGSQAHYYGVVGTSYGSGIAGYAYVPGRAGVGWDKSGSALRVTAHELGHNFSRRHVAACGSGNTDANYPYAGGIISNFGWNSGTNELVNTTVTDIMGYCGTQWISDYTWSAVMNYRGTSGMVAGFGATTQPTLMVWGRIKDGVVTLEPAVRLTTTPAVAQRPGRYRLELRDKTGRVLTGFSFDPEVVDHDENASAFAFAVPLSAVVEGRLSSVAIVGGVNGTVEQTARVPMAYMMGDSASAPAQISADGGSATVTDPTPRVSRSGGSTRITWDDQAWPLALVKDAQSGQTLSYLRKSGDGFLPRGSQVRVVFSNGIQSVTKVLSTQ